MTIFVSLCVYNFFVYFFLSNNIAFIPHSNIFYLVSLCSFHTVQSASCWLPDLHWHTHTHAHRPTHPHTHTHTHAVRNRNRGGGGGTSCLAVDLCVCFCVSVYVCLAWFQVVELLGTKFNGHTGGTTVDERSWNAAYGSIRLQLLLVQSFNISSQNLEKLLVKGMKNVFKCAYVICF